MAYKIIKEIIRKSNIRFETTEPKILNIIGIQLYRKTKALNSLGKREIFV